MHLQIKILLARLLVISAAVFFTAQGVQAGDQEKPLVFIRDPDILYVGTPHDIASRMLKVAGVKKQDLVYDLGCGDGRMLVLAAQKYGCRAKGLDIDPAMVDEARRNVKNNRVENLVTIEQADIFTADFSDADVVLMYLLPEIQKRLLPQLQKLKPGSRLVTHDYVLEGIKPDFSVFPDSNEDNANHAIYLYTIPLKPEGEVK